MEDANKPGRSANPVVWLVLAIPAATVVAGFWTLWVAAGDNAIDTNPDPVRRTAQVQVVSLEADEVAADRGLAATLSLQPEGALVAMDSSAGPVAPLLQLVHPIESTLDRQLVLVPDPRGWRANEPVAAKHGWYVRLVAADGSWRLVGRYQPGDTELRLEPAVTTP
ncbi:MAG: FixH family protein [Rhizobium sp.]|nr:FixH family protein [Rhizobium sp.]